MGKNPGYLPASVWTVGAMIDDRMHITWMCGGHGTCKKWGTVDLFAVRKRRGPDFCMVDKVSTCRTPGCGGTVYFHYSPGLGTPSRPLRAQRERQDAAKAKAEDREMAEARALYNSVARRLRRPTLP